ncbi:MAG: icmL [Francisellaceae bacterium]|nr:icmL [Francisellaceae bacterium]
MIENQGLETIIRRNSFYYNHYRQMSIIVLILFMILLGCCGFLYLLYLNRVAPVYFPTTADGRTIHVPPLTEPFLSDEQIKSWVLEAVSAAYSRDYINYTRNKEDARRYFTDKGYTDFFKAYDYSNNIESVISRKQIVHIVLTDDIKIINTELFANRFAWRVTLPIKSVYENGNPDDTIEQNLLATVLVIRASPLEANDGVAIHQLVFEATG